MAKFTYRGVTYDTAEARQDAPRHGEDLRYRGVRYDGDKAEAEARAAATDHPKIYRGAPVDAARR